MLLEASTAKGARIPKAPGERRQGNANRNTDVANPEDGGADDQQDIVPGGTEPEEKKGRKKSGSRKQKNNEAVEPEDEGTMGQGHNTRRKEKKNKGNRGAGNQNQGAGSGSTRGGSSWERIRTPEDEHKCAEPDVPKFKLNYKKWHNKQTSGLVMMTFPVRGETTDTAEEVTTPTLPPTNEYDPCPIV